MFKFFKQIYEFLTSPPSSEYLFSIGEDVWILILSNLNRHEITSFSLVCKYFNKITNNQNVWRNAFLKTRISEIINVEKLYNNNNNNNSFKRIAFRGPFYDMRDEDISKIRENLCFRLEVSNKIKVEGEYNIRKQKTSINDLYEGYRKTIKIVMFYNSHDYEKISEFGGDQDLTIFEMDALTKCFLFKKPYCPKENFDFLSGNASNFVLLIDNSNLNITLGFIHEITRRGKPWLARMLLIFDGVSKKDIESIKKVFYIHGDIIVECKVFQKCSFRDIKDSIDVFLKKSIILKDVVYSKELNEAWSSIIDVDERYIKDILDNWIPERAFVPEFVPVNFEYTFRKKNMN